MEIPLITWLCLLISLKSYLVFGQRENDQTPTISSARKNNFKPLFGFSHHPADIDIGLSEWASKNQNQFTVGTSFGGVKHPIGNDNILSPSNRGMDDRKRGKTRFPEDGGNTFRNPIEQPGNRINTVLRDLDSILNFRIKKFDQHMKISSDLSKDNRPTTRRGFLNVNANELLLSTLNILRDEINAAQSSAEINDILQAEPSNKEINMKNNGKQNMNIRTQTSKVKGILHAKSMPDKEIHHVENKIQDRNTIHLQSSANIDNNKSNMQDKIKTNNDKTMEIVQASSPGEITTKHNEPLGIQQISVGESDMVNKKSTSNERVKNIDPTILNNIDQSNLALEPTLDNNALLTVDTKLNSQVQSENKQKGRNQQNREFANSNTEPVNVDAGSVDMSFIPDQSAPGGKIPFINNLEELLSKIPDNGKPHVVITLDSNFDIASIEKTDNIPTTRAPLVTTTELTTPTMQTSQLPKSKNQTGSQPHDKSSLGSMSKNPHVTKPSISTTEDINRFQTNKTRKSIPMNPLSDKESNADIPIENVPNADNNRWFTPKDPHRSNVKQINDHQITDSEKTKLPGRNNEPPKDMLDQPSSQIELNGKQQFGQEPQSGKKNLGENVDKAVIADILNHVALLENDAKTGTLTDEMLAEMGRVLALNAIRAIRDRAFRLKKRTNLNPVDVRGKNARFYPTHINEVDINRISNPFDGVDLSDIVGLSDALGSSQSSPVIETSNADKGRTNRENNHQEPNRVERKGQASIKGIPREEPFLKNRKGTGDMLFEHSNKITNGKTNNNNFQSEQASIDTNRNNDHSRMVFGSETSLPTESNRESKTSLEAKNDANVINDASPMVFGSDLRNAEKFSGQSRNEFKRHLQKPLSNDPVSVGDRDFQTSRLNPEIKAQSDIQRIVFGSEARRPFHEQFQHPSSEKHIQNRNNGIQTSQFNAVGNIKNETSRMVFGSDNPTAFNGQIDQSFPEHAISKSDALEAILSSKAKAIDISKDESVSLSHILTDGLDLSSDSLNIGHPNDIKDLSPGPEDIIYDFSSESEFMKFLVRMNDGHPVLSDQIQMASDVANGFTTVPSRLESQAFNDRNLKNTDINKEISQVTTGDSTNHDLQSKAIVDSQSVDNVRNNVKGRSNQKDPNGISNERLPVFGITETMPVTENINSIPTNQNRNPNEKGKHNIERNVSGNADVMFDTPSHILFNRINKNLLPSINEQNVHHSPGDRNKQEDTTTLSSLDIHNIQQSIIKHPNQKTPDIFGRPTNNLLPKHNDRIESNRRDNKGIDLNIQRQNLKNLIKGRELPLQSPDQINSQLNPNALNRTATQNTTTDENKQVQNKRPTTIHKVGNLEIHTYPEFIIEFDHARGLTRRRRIRGPSSLRQRPSSSLTKSPSKHENQLKRLKPNTRLISPNLLQHTTNELNSQSNVGLRPSRNNVRNNQAQPQNPISISNIKTNPPSDQHKRVPNKDRPFDASTKAKIRNDETRNQTPLTDLKTVDQLGQNRLGRLGHNRQFTREPFGRVRPLPSFRFGENRPATQNRATDDNKLPSTSDRKHGQLEPLRTLSNVDVQRPTGLTHDQHLSNNHPTSFEQSGLQFPDADPQRLTDQGKPSTNADNNHVQPANKPDFQFDHRNKERIPSSPATVTSIDTITQKITMLNKNKPTRTNPSSALSSSKGSEQFPEENPFAFMLDTANDIKDSSSRGSIQSKDSNNRHPATTISTETQQIGELQNKNLPMTTSGVSVTPTIQTTTVDFKKERPVINFNMDLFGDINQHHSKKNTTVPKNQGNDQSLPSTDDKVNPSKNETSTSEKPIWNWIVDELHSVWTTFKK